MMTKVAYHLICDCKKAVNAYTCPVSILAPTVNKEYRYFSCSHCKMDFTCDHALKISFEFDESGLPVQTSIVCGRCETKLEERLWPVESEDLERSDYPKNSVSIYQRNY